LRFEDGNPFGRRPPCVILYLVDQPRQAAPQIQIVRIAGVQFQIDLFKAVEKLGLKLEPRKAPIEVLVVDQALKMPTEK